MLCSSSVRAILLSAAILHAAAFQLSPSGAAIAPLSGAPRAVTMTAAARRQILNAAALAGGLLPLLDGLPAAAADRRPVLVLGASGGTGRECVDYLLAQGRPCIAATRNGAFDAAPSRLLSVATGDVTSRQSMEALITPGLGGVIFAASASRQKDAKASSNAKAVDYRGVVDCGAWCPSPRAPRPSHPSPIATRHAAKLCISADVPRMVLVSSGGVSKPTSAVYLFLNLAANGIMDAKM